MTEAASHSLTEPLAWQHRQRRLSERYGEVMHMYYHAHESGLIEFVDAMSVHETRADVTSYDEGCFVRRYGSPSRAACSGPPLR